MDKYVGKTVELAYKVANSAGDNPIITKVASIKEIPEDAGEKYIINNGTITYDEDKDIYSFSAPLRILDGASEQSLEKYVGTNVVLTYTTAKSPDGKIRITKIVSIKKAAGIEGTNQDSVLKQDQNSKVEAK